MKVEFLKPDIRKSDIRRMVESIETGWLVRGAYTKTLESELGDYMRGQCLITSSCTASLHMALVLANVGPGDEVITTPMSWVATANVILYQGAKVVFADIDPKTGILDINEVKKKITPKTKAIILVHLYGQMADMKAFSKLGIPIIEDAAHALEAERDGVKPGELGLAACLSFHAAKNLTSGQGGAIITRDYGKCELMIRDGVRNVKDRRMMLDFGYKYDLTDFQAALLIGQVQRIKTTHQKRCEVFKRYEDAFCGKIKFPERTGKHACHMFAILVDPSRRDAIRANLASRGIQTSIHYIPIHQEPFYQKRIKVSLPVAERFGASVITLPTYLLTRAEQTCVIKEVLNEVGTSSKC
jgi:dTDP-4-amino-4,6-dideoxygalactose transaminase